MACYYSTEKDARKSASKAYVESLKTRIQSLESTLAGMGVSVKEDDQLNDQLKDLSDRMDVPSSPVSYHSPSEEAEPKSPGPLMIKDTGDLHMYGPTSAYSHLPGRPLKAASISNAPSEDSLSAHESESSRMNDLNPLNPILPPEVHLSEDQHNQLLNRFFNFYASWCMRADQTQFNKGMKSAALRSSQKERRHHISRRSSRHQGSSRYSPMLHNAILALACTYADDPILQSQRVRDLFGMKAKGMIDQECLRPTLATVEALALLSSYHASKMEDGLFSLHLGMAVRMGEALGLNVDCSAWVRTGHITQQDAVDRVSVFWSIFIQDKLYALFVGRNPSIPASIVTTPLPAVDPTIDDELWNYEGPSEQITSQPSYLSTTFVETCKASVILARILDVNYAVKATTNQLNQNIQVSDIRVQLDAWYDQLPTKLRILPSSPFNAMPHVLMLHVSYWWFSILLHRPFYPFPDTHQIAVKRCDAATDKIVQFFEIWRKVYGLRFTPVTAIQAAFATGTTYLLAAMHSNPNTKRCQDAIKGSKTCIQHLREMGTTYQAGNQNADILENLLKEWTDTASGGNNKMKTDSSSHGGGDLRSAIKKSSTSPEPVLSAHSPSDSQRSSSSRPATTPTQKPAILGVHHQNTYHPSTPTDSSPGSVLLGEAGTNSNHQQHSPQQTYGPHQRSHRQHTSPTAPNSDTWQGSAAGSSSGPSGSPSNSHSAATTSYSQAYVPDSFQRVLSSMDAAPFSYNTFGIESASNPFPPLPHPYMYYGSMYTDSATNHMGGYGTGPGPYAGQGQYQNQPFAGGPNGSSQGGEYAGPYAAGVDSTGSISSTQVRNGGMGWNAAGVNPHSQGHGQWNHQGQW